MLRATGNYVSPRCFVLNRGRRGDLHDFTREEIHRRSKLDLSVLEERKISEGIPLS